MKKMSWEILKIKIKLAFDRGIITYQEADNLIRNPSKVVDWYNKNKSKLENK